MSHHAGMSAGTVLVVDDNEDIRFLLEQVLVLSGYDVVLAADGTEAVTLLREVHLAPDLAILDVEMPEVSGWEVLRAIRADPATLDLPVIICTVRGDVADIEESRTLRCDGFVQKPFDVDLLVAEVSDVLAGRP